MFKFFSLIVCFAAVTLSFAQVRPVVSSLEHLTSSAESVVFGKLVSVGDEKPVKDRTYTEFTVTCKVAETLKGPLKGTFEFQRHDSDAHKYFSGALSSGDEFIVFVHPTTDGIYVSLENVTKDFAIPCMDYKVMSTRKDLAARVRSFTKANPKANGVVSLMLSAPNESVRPARGIVDFLLPAGPQLEPLLKQYIQRPQSFLTPPAKVNPPDVIAEHRQGCQEDLMRREAIFTLSCLP